MGWTEVIVNNENTNVGSTQTEELLTKIVCPPLKKLQPLKANVIQPKKLPTKTDYYASKLATPVHTSSSCTSPVAAVALHTDPEVCSNNKPTKELRKKLKSSGITNQLPPDELLSINPSSSDLSEMDMEPSTQLDDVTAGKVKKKSQHSDLISSPTKEKAPTDLKKRRTVSRAQKALALKISKKGTSLKDLKSRRSVALEMGKAGLATKDLPTLFDIAIKFVLIFRQQIASSKNEDQFFSVLSYSSYFSDFELQKFSPPSNVGKTDDAIPVRRVERGGEGGGADVLTPSVSLLVPTRADYDAISQALGGIDNHFVLVCGRALAPVDKQFASPPPKISRAWEKGIPELSADDSSDAAR
ncbi:hypothetical protein HNY73_013456 [Argiope bruennichi]|uniref:Uncharacterized protein n=1 Tax=Argiope bruennichi TaxID=94029 RepID=A0A8T0EZV4_ARGBR|nr:hypothetical protein HNY73_013456 [Argiope bruennichi]